MAWRNAARNGLEHRSHFATADLYADPNVPMQEIDVLVLDPPRSGAGPNLDRWLAAFEGRECVYVSCNPHTFATDAAIFARAGFELCRVGIFDMFPNTSHVETMGYFRRG